MLQFEPRIFAITMDNETAWKLVSDVEKHHSNRTLHIIEPDLKKGLRFAKKHHHNDLYLHFAKALHFYYFGVLEDEKKGKIMSDEWSQARALFDIEQDAKKRFGELMYLINRSRKHQDEIIDQLSKFYHEFHQHLAFRNTSISRYLYQLFIIYHYAIHDYDTGIKLCQEAIDLFEQHKLNKSHHFYALLVPRLIIEGHLEEALEFSRRAQEQIQSRNYSYKAYIYYEVLTLIHLGEYQEAYQRTKLSERKKQINPAIEEQWLITKGFFQILANAGRIQIARSFRIQKILNEVPTFEKDKFGNFINLLILRIIIDVQNRNIDRLVKNRDTYERTYLRYTEPGDRERIFLLMLVRIITFQFDKEKIGAVNTDDLEALRQSPMRPEFIDLVPWAVLWEITYDAL